MLNGINKVLSSMASGVFLDATYFSNAWTVDEARPHDMTGVAPSPEGETCKVQIDDASWTPGASGGPASATRKIMILCSSLDATPTAGDQIEMTPPNQPAERFTLGKLIGRDPASVYWLFEVAK